MPSQPAALIAYAMASLSLWGGLNWGMGQSSPEMTERKFALLKAAPPQAPWQLWGTSHVVHGIRPARFDPRFQNLAFHSSSPSYYLAWYALWRKHQPAPKRILWGMDSFLLSIGNPGARQFAQDAAFWPLADVAASMASERPNRLLLSNLVPMLRQRDLLADAMLGVVRYEDFYHPESYDAGFFVYDRPALPPPAPPAADFQAKLRPPLQGQGGIEVRERAPALQDLRELLARLQADGVRVEAIQAPYHRPLSASEHAANRRLEALLAAHHIPFLNFNGAYCSDINTTEAFYSDHTHLNGRGASYFSAFLRGMLKQKGWI